MTEDGSLMQNVFTGWLEVIPLFLLTENVLHKTPYPIFNVKH